MIRLTSQSIEQALPKVQAGLIKYSWLQENLYKVDVSNHREFQRKYNGFYRVRRNSIWQQPYFNLLEIAKTTKLSFEEALAQIFITTGKLEASFASKLVATANPNLPVIDKFVLENVGLKLPPYSAQDRELGIVAVYNQLISKFNDFANTEEGNLLVSRFQEVYGSSNITAVKMIDLVLWQTR